jgi:hypothetical protein
MGLQKLVVAAAVTALYMLQLKRYVIATGQMTSQFGLNLTSTLLTNNNGVDNTVL